MFAFPLYHEKQLGSGFAEGMNRLFSSWSQRLWMFLLMAFAIS